jgi:integrase
LCGSYEARQFLESSRSAGDTLYAAYVLILVLGLRKGEVLGLTWELVDLDEAELFVEEQLQRVSRRLLRRKTKTEASEAPLPLPATYVLCWVLSFRLGWRITRSRRA